MELTSTKAIKEILAKHGTAPSKGLGQNFLIDKNILEKIIITADITKADYILEVGPGMGTLTQELAGKAGQVTAVEKDRTMLPILKETLANFNNIEIIVALYILDKSGTHERYSVTVVIATFSSFYSIRRLAAIFHLYFKSIYN